MQWVVYEPAKNINLKTILQSFFQISYAPNFDIVVIYFLSTLKPACTVRILVLILFFLNA